MLPVQNLHKRRPVRRKQSVNVNDIEVSPVNLSQPSLNNSIVDLNWERYQGYYLHYEIEVRNYSSGSGGYRRQQLAVINNKLSITPLSFLFGQPCICDSCL
jgi:hypothetical protein